MFFFLWITFYDARRKIKNGIRKIINFMNNALNGKVIPMICIECLVMKLNMVQMNENVDHISNAFQKAHVTDIT